MKRSKDYNIRTVFSDIDYPINPLVDLSDNIGFSLGESADARSYALLLGDEDDLVEKLLFF